MKDCVQRYFVDWESQSTEAAVNEAGLELALQELDALIGLRTVKDSVRTSANFARIQMRRAGRGLVTVSRSFHTVFSGNPGTGKTSVARLMGKIYKALGVMSKGYVVECDRSKLVAEYIGQTAVKTNAVIDSALDCVLFIDAAYSLAQPGEGRRLWKDFGQEAIEVLLKRMEDDRRRPIVIVAGYTHEMQEFIAANPGLKSRFANQIEFPDYSPEELVQIFIATAGEKGLACTPPFRDALIQKRREIFANKGLNFGNARDIRNLFEATSKNQGNRLVFLSNATDDDFQKLLPVDLP